jgi:small conductance mechanosensitive channel
MADFLSGETIIAPEKAVKIVLILGVAYLTRRITGRALRKVLNDYITKVDHTISRKVKDERVKTLGAVISNLTSLLIWGVAVLITLSELAINIAPLIAGVGVMGLGVGFASQTLVKDYISGFFILFENQFNVGDEIEIGGKRGAVRDLSLRTTILEDGEGSLHIVPNSKITTVTRYEKS